MPRSVEAHNVLGFLKIFQANLLRRVLFFNLLFWIPIPPISLSLVITSQLNRCSLLIFAVSACAYCGHIIYLLKSSFILIFLDHCRLDDEI